MNNNNRQCGALLHFLCYSFRALIVANLCGANMLDFVMF